MKHAETLEELRPYITNSYIYEQAANKIAKMQSQGFTTEEIHIEKIVIQQYRHAKVTLPQYFLDYEIWRKTEFQKNWFPNANNGRGKRSKDPNKIAVKPHYSITASTPDTVIAVNTRFLDLAPAIEFLLHLVKTRPNEQISISLLYTAPIKE